MFGQQEKDTIIFELESRPPHARAGRQRGRWSAALATTWELGEERGGLTGLQQLVMESGMEDQRDCVSGWSSSLSHPSPACGNPGQLLRPSRLGSGAPPSAQDTGVYNLPGLLVFLSGLREVGPTRYLDS